MKTNYCAIALVFILAALPLLGGTVFPSNDDFIQAETLAGFPVSAIGHNVGATIEPDEPVDEYATGSVWYQWVAPVTTNIQINTFGSDFDTVLFLWSGSALTSLTQIAENDQYGGNQSAVFVNVQSGQTYRIAVYGWYGDEGNILLNITNDTSSSISGRVTGPDMAPLAGITIRVFERDVDFDYWYELFGVHAFTDTNGYYRIGGLATGVYRVGFADYESGDYVDEYFDDAPDVDSATDVSLTLPGAAVTNINATLEGASRIEGRITDVTGTIPVNGIAIAYVFTNGFWIYVSGADVDSEGNYSIGRLRAGTYRVFFDDNDYYYAGQAYSNALTLESGTDITVLPTSTVMNINGYLLVGSVIEGRVTSVLDGLPIEGIDVFIFITDACPVCIDQVTLTDSNGYYRAAGLSPGTYEVFFRDQHTPFGYLDEWYNNSLDRQYSHLIVLPASTTVSNIDAVLETWSNSEQPVIVGTRHATGDVFNISFTCVAGDDYGVLEEVTDLSGEWVGTGVVATGLPGTNTLTVTSFWPHAFWQIDRYPAFSPAD